MICSCPTIPKLTIEFRPFIKDSFKEIVELFFSSPTTMSMVDEKVSISIFVMCP